jgi:hypothetical protein
MLQVNVDLVNSTPITVVGMYCPHQMPARKHLYDIYTRHKTDRTTVVAGDFNATFQDSERASGVKRPQDEAHRAFMAQHGLAPVSRPSLAPQAAPRQYTYRKGASETKCSRIDDILLSRNVEANATVDTISMAGRSSDHDPLAAAIPFTLLGLMPPLPELPDRAEEPRLARLTDATKTVLRMQLLETHGAQFDVLASLSDDIVSQYVRPHWHTLERHHTAEKPKPLQTVGGESARQMVDDLGESMSQLSRAVQTDHDGGMPHQTHQYSWAALQVTKGI